MGFTGFYWVLLGFTGFYWVLLGFTGFNLFLLGFTWWYWVLLGFTGFYWVRVGFKWVFLLRATVWDWRAAKVETKKIDKKMEEMVKKKINKWKEERSAEG